METCVCCDFTKEMNKYSSSLVVKILSEIYSCIVSIFTYFQKDMHVGNKCMYYAFLSIYFA